MMQYHSLEVTSPLWIVAAHKAASQGNAMQLPAPDGMRGSWAVRSYPLADGVVRWTLTFTDKRTGKQTQVAKWLTDWMPEEHCEMRAPKPIRTAGRIVTINRGIAGEVERQVRVVIDSLGLPYPVPVEVMR